MQISELAARCGVTTHALRHYERLGLLQPLPGCLRISDMVASLQGRVTEIDQQMLALAAQRAEVVSHIAWLQAQQQKSKLATSVGPSTPCL